MQRLLQLHEVEYPGWTARAAGLLDSLLCSFTIWCVQPSWVARYEGEAKLFSGLLKCPQCCPLPAWRFTATDPADAEKAKNYGVRFQAVPDHDVILLSCWYCRFLVDRFWLMLMLIDVDWQQCAPLVASLIKDVPQGVQLSILPYRSFWTLIQPSESP